MLLFSWLIPCFCLMIRVVCWVALGQEVVQGIVMGRLRGAFIWPDREVYLFNMVDILIESMSARADILVYPPYLVNHQNIVTPR